MKKILLFLMFCIAITAADAQQQGCDCSSEDDYNFNLQQGLIGIEYSNPVKGYEGDQYLRDWAFGEIRLNNGELIKNLILRYDRYMDEVLWLRKSDYRKGLLNKRVIKEFSIYKEGIYPEALFVKKRIRLPWMDTTEVFVHMLVQGKLELFAFRNVKVEPVEYKLYDDTKHVISTEGKDYLIPLRRKYLLDMPFINKAEMKKVLRRNHLAIRNNEQALTMAIRYYNQL